MDSYQKFEDAIVEYWEAQGTSSVRRPYWSDAGEPLLEIPLLEKLLTVAVRDELRAAGFDAQSVWPRLVRPRVLDPSVLRFIGSLDARTAEKCCEVLPRFASANASVLGSTYCKQVDVGPVSYTHLTLPTT